MILKQLDMVERAFDQRLGAGLAIFFEQILFQAAGVDPDADRAAVRLRRADDLADALRRSDIAGVDAQAGGPGVGGFQRALQIGRASCRERVCQSGSLSVGAVSIKNKTDTATLLTRMRPDYCILMSSFYNERNKY